MCSSSQSTMETAFFVGVVGAGAISRVRSGVSFPRNQTRGSGRQSMENHRALKYKNLYEERMICIKILVDKMPGQKNDCPFSEKTSDSIGYLCALKKRKTRGPFACTREQCPYLKPMFERKVKANDN